MRQAIWAVFCLTAATQDPTMIYHRLTIHSWIYGERMPASRLRAAYDALRPLVPKPARAKRRSR